MIRSAEFDFKNAGLRHIDVAPARDSLSWVRHNMWGGSRGTLTHTGNGKTARMIMVGEVSAKTAIAGQKLRMNYTPEAFLISRGKYDVESWLWYFMSTGWNVFKNPLRMFGTKEDLGKLRTVMEIAGFSDWPSGPVLEIDGRPFRNMEQLWGGANEVGQKPLIGIPVEDGQSAIVSPDGTKAQLLDPRGLWRVTMADGTDYFHNVWDSPLAVGGTEYPRGISMTGAKSIFEPYSFSDPVLDPGSDTVRRGFGTTLIGGGNVATPDKANTCFAVHLSPDNALLVDFGANPFIYPSSEIRNNMARTLKAGLLTHNHVDHRTFLMEVAETFHRLHGTRFPLYVLRETWEGCRQGDFGTARIIREMTGMNALDLIKPIFLDADISRIDDSSARRTADLGNKVLLEYGIAWHDIPTLGHISFCTPEGTIAISSDTKDTRNLRDWVRDMSKRQKAQIWLNFGGGGDGRQPDHTTVAAVKAAAAGNGAELLLYHTPRRNGPATIGNEGTYYPVK